MKPILPGSRPDPSPRPQPASWPDWKLERYLLGELPAAEARRLEADREGDADLARRVQSLAAEHQALRASHPAGPMAAGIARRLRATQAAPASAATARAPRFAWPRLPAPVWAPALGMILLLALIPFTPYSPFLPSGDAGKVTPEDGGGERLKGLKGFKPRLLLHRKAPEGSVLLRDGERVRSGDLIQIQYESAGRAQGALYSLDAEGKVTRHLPDRGDRSAALETGRAGGPVALAFAYELDDAEGWERFFLIASDRPFDLPAVEAALRGLRAAGPGGPDSLALPPRLEQSSFILLKEPGT